MSEGYLFGNSRASGHGAAELSSDAAAATGARSPAVGERPGTASATSGDEADAGTGSTSFRRLVLGCPVADG